MRKAGEGLKALRIPRTVLEPIRQVLDRHAVHVSFADMLTQLGVTREQFEDPAFSIDGEELYALFDWVEHNARGSISIRDWLSHFSATSAGLAGMAALSARNVRESLLVAVRYLPLLIPVMRADLVEAPPKVLFKLEMAVDLGRMNSFLLEIVTAAVHVISNDVMSESVPRIIHFRHGHGNGQAATAHRRDLEEIFSSRIIFNSHFDGMEGRMADMDVATRSPNEATFNTVKRILEDEISTRQGVAAFSVTVHQELVRLANAGHFPSLEEFADRMNLSPRTLIRKLSGEQTSFKSIANEVWFRLAKELLLQTRFSVKQIAARTGFNNTNSFSRAFKSLSGETPLAWRTRQLP
ncbi:MAG: helix-turn-helix domain-containing protein [Alcanivoracaceae bacterium]|jgi:AraC-like DNA-binding protein|nr:helix-turn-helix domain-containing protein [Alcanivoracaceae bacterium]